MRPLEFTKLVCTIGPSCDDTTTLKKMIEGGLNIARLNLSHGDHQYHGDVIRKIRKISPEIAVMLDTKGPEIRTDVLDDPLDLAKGEILTLTNKGTDPGKRMIRQSHPGLAKDIKVGDRVLISDGAVQLKVTSISGDDVKCRVLSDCILGSNKSVIVPGREMSLPNLTGKDREDLAFGFEHDVDFIALSYLTEASTVQE
ncbi:MAG: pyruvate kinase, partial [Candidatus Undinarchaeales archaeon]|nr:pyruvate kinase [Candidatus Undinarchaeales archaeon]